MAAAAIILRSFSLMGKGVLLHSRMNRTRLATGMSNGRQIILKSQVDQFCGRMVSNVNNRQYSQISNSETVAEENSYNQEGIFDLTSRENISLYESPLQPSVASQLVKKWVRHLERRDEPGRAPVMCLICLEEKHLQDEEILKRVAWASSYLFRSKLRNIILIGFDKKLQNTTYNFEKLPHRLAEQLFKHGAYSHVFSGANNPMGFTGPGTGIGIAEDLVNEALLTETIPIFTNLLDSSNSNSLFISDLMSTAEVVARCVQPYRMLFVDPAENLRRRMTQPHVRFPKTTSSSAMFDENNQSEKFSDISKLLYALSDLNAVSVVSPSNIVHELHEPGKGKYITRSENVMAFTSLDNVDVPKLSDILTSAFDKGLQSNYFDRIKDKIHVIYITENHKGAAIILKDKHMPIPYMDKIAVHRDFQGQGLNLALWDQIHHEVPQLFWRSRHTNLTANRWYNKVCQGFWKFDKTWTVFWYGLETMKRVPELLKSASQMPESFDV